MMNFLRKLLDLPVAPAEPKVKYTEEELMARLKVFIGVCLALTLFGIVFVVLYSLIFVTQPLNAISPIDTKFFELIIPIATFLTGTLSGIMLAGGNKDLQAKALEAATRAPEPSAPIASAGRSGFSASASFGGANMSFNKPATGFGSAPLGRNSMSTAPFAAAASDLGAKSFVATNAKGQKVVPQDDDMPEL